MKLLIVIATAVVLISPLAVQGAHHIATYEKDIKPILAAKCLNCHGKGAPTMAEFKKDKEKYKKMFKGPKMDSYKDISIMVNGSDSGAIMRRLDDGKSAKDGKPGNMYQYLGGDDDEKQKNLGIFKKWVGSWNLKKRAVISDAELKKITAPEK